MKKTVHIIGGGIIGLTSAWYLMDHGYDVVVIDRDDLTDGTSHGNAGMIVPSHFIPMAAPGVISQGIKWMFDPTSPFYVKPRLDWDLAQWMWTFFRSCNQAHVDRCAPSLFQFNEWSKHLYRLFSKDERFSFCFEEKGLLMLYKTSHQQDEEAAMAESAHKLGIEARVLDGKGVAQLEPNINLDVLGGVYYPGDAHLYPNLFVGQLRLQLERRGAQIIGRTEIKDFRQISGRITHLVTTTNKHIAVEEVVLSGGSWTPFLLKRIGVKILLQDGKGYSFTIQNPTQRPQIPTILTEGRVALTPMGDDLRIGGTLELGGLSTKVHKRRIDGIIGCVPSYYPQLSVQEQDLHKIWIGYRPCSPDGMPYIGRPKDINNLVIAAGHGMMGMSMGPATGKMVSEIIADLPTTISTNLYRINR